MSPKTLQKVTNKFAEKFLIARSFIFPLKIPIELFR